MGERNKPKTKVSMFANFEEIGSLVTFCMRCVLPTLSV